MNDETVLRLAALDAGGSTTPRATRDGSAERHATPLDQEVLPSEQEALQEARAHLSTCGTCRQRIDQQRLRLSDLSGATRDSLDAHFTPDRLDRQLASVMRRLAPGRERGRVLPFPIRASARHRPVSSPRRWVAAAAAAGMVFGIVTGRLISLQGPDGPLIGRAPTPPSAVEQTAAADPSAMEPTADALPDTLDDGEDFLLELDAALTSLRSPELRPLDDLTPRPSAVMASVQY